MILWALATFARCGAAAHEICTLVNGRARTGAFEAASQQQQRKWLQIRKNGAWGAQQGIGTPAAPAKNGGWTGK